MSVKSKRFKQKPGQRYSTCRLGSILNLLYFVISKVLDLHRYTKSRAMTKPTLDVLKCFKEI